VTDAGSGWGWDLARFEAMLDGFDRYVSGRDLYRKVLVETAEGRRKMTTMSIGVMLDLADSLNQLLRAPDGGAIDSERVARALERFDAARSEHREAYEGKLRREMKSNLDAWSWFLDDCAEGKRQCVDEYPSEVRKRLRLERLLAEAGRLGIDVSSELERLDRLDQRLGSMFERDEDGGYCGPQGDESLYPRTRFWWLYGRPSAGGG